MTNTRTLERFKIARITTKLKPHQQRVVDRMEDEDQPGLVAAHGLGSGKTLTSLAVQDALGLPADVVTPAALQANYLKEIKAHTAKAPPSELQSLEGVARAGGAGLTHPLLIVDEAHRIRNAGKARTGLGESLAEKRLALTGSLLYNHPSDIAGPINFVAGKSVFPEDPDVFSQRFLQDTPNKRGLIDRLRGVPASYQTHLNPRTRGYLQQALDKYVDYHPGSAENFPTRIDETIQVPMTRDQMGLYETITKDQPGWLKKKVLMNLPPTKAEAKQLNAFLSGARQISNTTSGFDTRTAPAHQPKIDRAVDELQKMLNANPRAKAIVYSHYLESGIDPYKKKLEELGIPHGAFTGDMSRKSREQMVRDYNDNKLKALLLSSAGGEGLDLKGTRLIQLLEPHWNQEKLKQVIGRGIRYKSHAALPEDERNVRVQRYLATRAPSGLLERIGLRKPGYGVDQYLDEMGVRKEQLNQQVRQMLREPENT
jgi:Helicase conserved C-terminal domain/SNF2-related domain